MARLGAVYVFRYVPLAEGGIEVRGATVSKKLHRGGVMLGAERGWYLGTSSARVAASPSLVMLNSLDEAKLIM